MLVKIEIDCGTPAPVYKGLAIYIIIILHTSKWSTQYKIL